MFFSSILPHLEYGSGVLGTVNSASGLVQGMNEVDDLYLANREWAEEQAQKQMDFQTSANKIAMDFNAAEADKARAWEAEMANTAYQRVVKDLKAAGLNPILAYSQGGAAVPSVNSAQGVTSSGAKAQMADTGYTSQQLSYAYRQQMINSALDILKMGSSNMQKNADREYALIGEALGFIKKLK